MKKYTILLFCFSVFMIMAPSPAQGADENPLTEKIRDGFNYRGDVLGYGYYQYVETSRLNPYNVLGLIDQRLAVVLRPDLELKPNSKIAFHVKPRFSASRDTWGAGIFKYKSSEKDTEAYINEWSARIAVTERIFFFGGRENLQWGPSCLLSPSNPFYRENGRNNPYLEQPGLDYLKAVWLPSNAWTFSFFANVGNGRYESVEAFKNKYALKIDVTKYQKYLSLITSAKEGEKSALGFFAGIAPTDCLLLHIEGHRSWETNTTDVVAGGGYTFLDGSTVTMEYFYQGDGCRKEPIEQCLVPEGLYEELEDDFNAFDGTVDELLTKVEALELQQFSRSFVRKNYLLLQYVKPRIHDTLTFTGRYIFNVDDRSSRMVGMANLEINDSVALLMVANVFAGGTDTEYGSLLNHSVMAGVIFSY